MKEAKLRPGDTGIEKLRLSQMNVDMTYQRDPRKRLKKIGTMVAKYDRRLLGTPHVCRRKDGSLWLIDGAGRQLVMARVGDDTPIDCIVHYHIKSVEEEADWFLRLNPDEVARVNAGQKFKARLGSNDKNAIAINAAALKGGLVITGAGKNGISIQAAECLFDLGNLSRVGFIKKSAWENQKPGGPHYVALGAVLHGCPDINEGRLRHILSETPPSVLYATTLGEYGTTGMAHARMTSAKMARMLVKTYNFHASALRVKPNWKRVDDAIGVKHKDKWAVLD